MGRRIHAVRAERGNPVYQSYQDPEYLAAGKRVVSTPIADVVRTYGRRGLVRIAATPVEFIAAIQATLVDGGNYDAWLRAADGLLETMSWDQTWADMRKLMA